MTDFDPSNLPHFVYEFIDAEGSHLYVGCTSNLGQRINNHRSEKEWFGQIARIEADLYPTQRAALDAERERIELYQPAHNSVHTDRYDGGGWGSRRAKMTAAHAAGKPCDDKTCREGCDEKAHRLGVTCSRNYGCPDCQALMPVDFLDDPVSADCWRELAQRYGGVAATELVWDSPRAIDALAADEAGMTAVDLRAHDWLNPVTARRSA